MTLSRLARQLERFAIDNSPAILTAIGVAGTVATAVLTHRAAQTTFEILIEEDAKRRRDDEPALSRKEIVKLTWKGYIPPICMGTLTCTAIIFANHVGTKRATAAAAAYTLSEKAFTEYKAKVTEKFGENKARQVRDEIAQDRVRNNPPPEEGNVLMVGEGDHLFIDMWSGRYFRSSMETVRKALNDLNYDINTHGYASLSDWYHLIGLAPTAGSDQMGWNSDKMVEIDFSAVLSEDGRPCVAINLTSPFSRHDRFSS